MGVNLLPHNEETYGRMIEMFKTDKRVGVVQPTGTGKSFLMLKWIEDHIDEDIVVLSPSNVLFTQLYKYADQCNLDISNVDMHTYQKLDRAEHSSIEMINANKIILDEFHRTGAEKWGESIDVLLDSHDKSEILGLTATPIRYLDKSKDMADEIFNNNLARYMTLGEAIEMGILPIPKYIPVWYDYNNKLTEYQKDINSITDKKEREECERLLRELKRNLQNSYGAEDVFKDNMPNDHGKYIVFCINNKHLKKMKKKMAKWLKGINTNIHNYITISKRLDKDKQVQEFIDDNDPTAIKLLFSINRLNEGLHVEGIDGVIMLRPTDSGIVYLQQMGRAFATENETPIIFDMVNNYQNVKAVDPDDPEEGYQNIFEKQIYGSALFRKKNISNSIFGIFEDMKKFNEIFEHIESVLYPDNYQRWDEKFEILTEFISQFNRMPRKREVYNNINISSWYYNQLNFYNKGLLSSEHIEKLESIGVIFNYSDKKWDENFEILKEFILKYDKMPKYKEIYNGKNIGHWLYFQRYRFNKGLLSPERIEKLESIGVVFKDRLSKKWDENFEILKEFINEFNRIPKRREVYNNINIGNWLSTQKINFNKGKFSEQRYNKLNSIGIYFIDGKTVFKKKDKE